MMTSNVHCDISAPRFCSLKLYNASFKVSVSLRVSVLTYSELLGIPGDYKPIEVKSRYYLHWEKSYPYGNVRKDGTYYNPFEDAFEEAWQVLRRMKIVARQQKIEQLYGEIEDIVSFKH